MKVNPRDPVARFHLANGARLEAGQLAQRHVSGGDAPFRGLDGELRVSPNRSGAPQSGEPLRFRHSCLTLTTTLSHEFEWNSRVTKLRELPGSAAARVQPVNAPRTRGSMRFADYEPGDFFDEMFDAARQPRAGRARARAVHRDAARRRAAAPPAVGRARAAQHRASPSTSTATSAGTERIFPFDLVPRIVGGARMEPDRARAEAADPRAQPVHRRHLPRAEDPQGRRRPGEHRPIGDSRSARQCVGLNPPRGIWCHITGTDLVRDTRRPDLRARRQPALPVRRVLRAARTAR